MNIGVLQADDISFGLVVEQVYNAQEIVIKNLDGVLKNIIAFSGGTIMGDGEIVLILDVIGLAQNALMIASEDSQDELIGSVASSKDEDKSQVMLIVSLSKKHRVAIRLLDVTRLEEEKKYAIETTGKGSVVQYRGEIMPLINIPQLFNASDELQEIRDNLKMLVLTHEEKIRG